MCKHGLIYVVTWSSEIDLSKDCDLQWLETKVQYICYACFGLQWRDCFNAFLSKTLKHFV